MKKILLAPIFLALSQMAPAQCPPFELPYVIPADAPAPLTLPACMNTSYNMFSSSEVFKTVPGPVAGFNGSVFAYNTVVNTEWGTPASAIVSASLSTNRVVLIPGVNYVISYKYGNSSAALNIDNLTVYLGASGIPQITVAAHDNITGATVTTFTSAPFTVAEEGEYTLLFDVWSTGTQGLLYIDDIAVYQEGTMGIKESALSGLVTYPNPVKEVLHITGNSMIDSAELFTLTGQSLLFKNINGTDSGIDTSALQAGVYVLALQAGNERKTIRIVKQ